MSGVPFDPESGAYVDTRVARGFPMGGIEARFDGTPVRHPLAAGLREGEDISVPQQAA